MHSDHPTLNDRLDRQTALTELAKQIAGCTAPQTFGVHGDWGAGKTSFLRQMRLHLDGNNDGCNDQANASLEKAKYKENVVTVWFDAWRYQHEAAPVIALLQEIRRQFGVTSKIKGATAKYTEVAFRSVLNSLDDVAKLLSLEAAPIGVKRIEEAGEKWEKENLASRLGIDTVQDFLEKAVESLLNSKLSPSKSNRIVVFIDDLDRCNPESAYRLLEGLKIYLNLKNCVFVIGMNQQLIVDAIASCMPKELVHSESKLKEAAFRIRAEAYLEKVCSFILRLNPPVTTRGIICQWIEHSDFRKKVEKALTDANGKEIRCFPPNARRIKALANLLNRWHNLCRQGSISLQDNQNTQALIVIAYVYQFHSEIFQRWQFTPSFLKHMSDWIKTGESKAAYFSVLQLPETSISAGENTPVPQVTYTSSFPNPYATDMFWISPLIREAKLTEQIIEPLMLVITQTGNTPQRAA